ncbi:hypothetical protein K505DRAFT_404462 [Melanomma pulvis-pyrius CBS 109.77]|uniref:Mid2 domain-containing protein n=1 Tax=Melanomma pulvis-pyrius CBS 109.77 TaxID=1314802 RepID=A0A6A6XVF6_9PLEO|nr:hypothetical protein K505DRAFT_404462 [Melanomma pulvis-pyrius CBS 109.77]
MARLLLVVVAAWLSTVVSCIDFINPPPFGEKTDFSQNPIYNEGSKLKVVWTQPEKGQPVTLTLTQLNGTEWMLPMEYLTQSVVDRTSYEWLVVTGKNLTESNMFFFCIFREGSTSADANSHYFNITPKAVAPAPSSSASPSSTTISISVSSSTLTPSASPTAPPSNVSSTTSVPTPSGGLTTGAKVGLGVGIPIAMTLGLAAGFFLFKHYRKKDNNALLTPGPLAHYSDQYNYHGNDPSGGYYRHMVEGAPKSPVELGQPEAELDGGAYKYSHTAHTFPGAGMTMEPARHELGATSPR